MRPDYGPGWMHLECDRCTASWVGHDGDPCGWCDRQQALLIEMQRELLLNPDLPDRDDERRSRAEIAWAERLGRAVSVGVVTRGEAEKALHREVARAS